MKDQRISMRQALTLLLLALFTMGTELLPALTQAGTALWLLPLLCLPLLWLGLHFFLRGQREKEEERRDLGDELLRVAGPLGGRLLCLLFLLWGFFLLSLGTTRCAARLATAEGSPLFFAALVLALSVWMAKGKLSAAARSCEIFYRILAVAMLGVLLMALPRLSPGYVLLLRRAELAALPTALLSLLGLLSAGLYVLFFAGSVSRRASDTRTAYRRLSLLLVSLSVLLFLILGSFGAALTQRLERPFFQMVAALGVSGAFQRLEALFSALWMLGDLAFFVLLLFAMKRLTATVTGRKESVKSAAFLATAALLAGTLLGQYDGVLRFCQEMLLPRGGLLIGALLLVLLFWTRLGRKVALAEEDGKEEESS